MYVTPNVTLWFTADQTLLKVTRWYPMGGNAYKGVKQIFFFFFFFFLGGGGGVFNPALAFFLHCGACCMFFFFFNSFTGRVFDRVCGRNRMMWPFKRHLYLNSHICYLFSKILQNEIWKFGRNLPLATFGSERVRTGKTWGSQTLYS